MYDDVASNVLQALPSFENLRGSVRQNLNLRAIEV